MLDYVHWIPLAPLIASLAIIFLGKEGERSKMPYLGIATMLGCFLLSCVVLAQALAGGLLQPFYRTIPWFSFGDFEMTLGVLIDGPAAVMLFVVTLVSLLVQVYSLEYMRGDPRFKRYYAFLSFFTASMLGLVVSSNLLVLFACWELVGVASYLLIGFWFENPGPAYASKKAFITTKLGDLGLYGGLLLLFAYTGTFDLSMLSYRVQLGPEYLPREVAAVVGLLFLFGAAGKSAQVPLFIWLPDAMEGPTPVSALIHAATMVAAGIYLVARTYFIFSAGPISLEIVAWIGLLTAMLAASMAVVATDIKRVLAFSTVSQLGYMMLGLGVGGYTSGLFHLTTHAFFKALLFLGAGSVIHAAHTNDLRLMGGLSKKMPYTFATMLVGTLAISGCPWLAGWYSKEAILHDVWEHSPLMWALALATAGLTSFYMFRLLFLTFLGRSRDHHKYDHAHESPNAMLWPLFILTALSVVSGAVLNHHGLFASIVHYGPEAAEGHAHSAPGWLAGGAFAAFLGGVVFSFRLYASGDLSAAAGLRETLAPVADMLEARYGFDRFFLALVALSDRLAAALHWIDTNIVDALFVDGWAVLADACAMIGNFFDNIVIDSAVDGVGAVTQGGGWALRKLVRGQVQEYLLYVALSVSLLFLIAR